jgi:hypothetical protein
MFFPTSLCISSQVHQSDSRISSDPTIEKHGVSVLCLILIKLKSAVLKICSSDPSVTPTIGSDRTQHCGSECDSESRRPTGNQSNSVVWLNPTRYDRIRYRIDEPGS